MSNASLRLTVDLVEAGQLLGVSSHTVRRLVQDGEIPAFRAGRGRLKSKVLIRREALTEYMEKREREGV